MSLVLCRASQLLLGVLVWLALAWAGQAPVLAQVRDSAPLPLKAIVAGGEHTCVVTAGGAVQCWGSNVYGQLGNGVVNSLGWLAIDVEGLTSGVQALAAGQAKTCALTAEGGVQCWGYDGVTPSSPTPRVVEGLGSGVQAITAGPSHMCALIEGGGVKCWGANWDGQLGDGTRAQQAIPVDVVGLPSGVQALAAGGAHTCALTDSGGVLCWGAGSGSNSLTPVAVPGLESGVQALAAGGSHTCALLVAGAVKCWGSNESGQLGINNRDNSPAPVTVPSLSSVKAITAGSAHTCALLGGAAGESSVRCWGSNATGQVGDGTLVDRLAPVNVPGVAGDVIALDAGSTHTCVLRASGGAQCWGPNYYNQLGNAEAYLRFTPAVVTDLGAEVQTVTAGENHTCALTASSKGPTGGVLCWGINWMGQLGDGGRLDRFQPDTVTGLDSRVRAVSAGDNHTCALTSAGGVWCWGDNWEGQLGNGTTQTLRREPVAVLTLGSGVQAIAAGRAHTCALTEGGGVWCWGDNKGGQLGDGTQLQRSAPVDVAGLGSGVRAVAAGLGLTCALTEGGGVKCWGATRVGDGTSALRSAPVDVTGLGSGVRAITVGDWHACALTDGGGVKCWGGNEFGQLGDGTQQDRLTPVDVAGLTSGVRAISAGKSATCAVLIDGSVRCWGWLRTGFGNRDRFWLLPMPVGGLDGVAQAVDVGAGHACVIATRGDAASSVQCWGLNHVGQLGVNPGWAPVDVLALLPRALFAPVVRQ